MSIRVNQGKSLLIEKKRSSSSGAKLPAFEQQLAKVEKDYTNEIAALVSRVEQTGEQLAKNVNINNLENYKHALKNLINNVVKNYGLHTEHIWSHQGHQRMLTAIRQIETHLNELIEEVTAKNSSQLKVLTKIEKIKGLLVDLYT